MPLSPRIFWALLRTNWVPSFLGGFLATLICWIRLHDIIWGLFIRSSWWVEMYWLQLKALGTFQEIRIKFIHVFRMDFNIEVNLYDPTALTFLYQSKQMVEKVISVNIAVKYWSGFYKLSVCLSLKSLESLVSGEGEKNSSDLWVV